MRLSELGELGLLAELERRGLARSIGDDAAHLGEGLVVTQDALVERVHFRLDLISWRDLGWRAAAVNLLELYEGMEETGLPVVGGDLTQVEEVILSVTAVGRSTRIPGRLGAQPGDR